MIFVSASISLDDSEFQERFIRSPGPGGQNANKVATAVQLRFDVARSPSLPIQVKRWLIQLAGRRLSNDGVLTIEAH
jgi:ribosome-associated protein